MSKGIWALGTIVVVAGIAHSQSFNVNLTNTAGPAPTYGAAGRPGTWNNIPGVQNVMYPLVGLDGSPTAVTVRNIGGTALLTGSNPGPAGDDAALLTRYRATFNPVETCLRFFNLADGTYQVITYAWLPDDATLPSRVVCDESFDSPQFIGGAWNGALKLGVTHAVHLATPINGQINVHSGLSSAAASVAALNGIQLRLLTHLDGNVGLGSGGPFDLLTINGSPGNGSHVVNVGIGRALTIQLGSAPGGLSPAPFILWGGIGPPGPSVFMLPFGIGTTSFPPCSLMPGAPGLFTVANCLFADPCGTLVPATFAPWTLALPAGIPAPIDCTLQGVIEEAPGSYAVLNAINLVIQ
jgi:hypothetical protein